ARTGPRRRLALAAVLVVVVGAASVALAQRRGADRVPAVTSSPDASLGIVRWQVPVGVQFMWWSSPVAAVGDTVVVSQAGALHGIDPDSGEVRWRRRLDVGDRGQGPGRPAVVEDHLLVVQDRASGGFVLRSVDPVTGLDVWVKREETGNASFLTADHSVYLQVWRPDSGDPVEGRRRPTVELARLDPATGEAQWRRGLDVAGWYSATGDDTVVLIGDEQIDAEGDAAEVAFEAVVIDGRNGEELWRRSLGVIHPDRSGSGFGPVAAVGRDRVLLVDTAGRLTAYDAATGSPAWEEAEGESRRDVIVVVGDLVLETGERNHIVARDLATGEPRWESEDRFVGGVPLGLATDDLLLVPYGGTKLTAVDLRDGATRWVSEGPAGFEGIVVGDTFVTVAQPTGNPSSPGPKVRAYDLASGAELWSQVLPFRSALGITGGPEWFATYEPGSALALRDTSTGKFLNYPSLNGQILSAAAGPGGELLLLAYDNRGESFLSSMGTESRHWEVAMVSEEANFLWSPPIGPVVVGDAVAVARDSTVYFHDLDEGALAATAELGRGVAGLVAASDGVLVRTADGTLALVPVAGGNPRWRIAVGPGGSLDPAVAGGTAYVAADVSEIAAIDLDDGGVVWRRDLGGPLSEAPAIAGGHVLAVLGQTVVALDAASGELSWRAEFASPPAGPPAALGDGIRLALTDGTVLALDPATGATTGQVILADPIAAGPWVFGDSTYVVTVTSRLVAIGAVPEAVATLSPVPITDEP
ncbi:MAG: PQQ-binding-like beta-propeller repeat protein, partial [Nitriliruptorales bacterium]